uniref:Male-enhanced antigen 1 n=1 Tax=Strigamia maritima TaxID=126957 RepID=T1IPX8_STRMM
MAPLPVCTVLDNPPDDIFDSDIDENMQNAVHIASSSDSEEEDQVQSENGYQLLPQEPTDQNLGLNENVLQNSLLYDQDNMSQGVRQHNILNLLPQIPPTGDGAVFLWNEAASERHQPMDPDEAEKIKAAMSGFSLPDSAVPAWAHLIPEDEWKEKLFANIRGVCPDDKSEIFEHDR